MKEYNKLVRDRIPEICEASGYTAKTRILEEDTEYLAALIEKLSEETAEVKDNPSLEELADVLEVLYGLGRALGYTSEQVEAARVKKAEERGGLDKRIFLISTQPADKKL